MLKVDEEEHFEVLLGEVDRAKPLFEETLHKSFFFLLQVNAQPEGVHLPKRLETNKILT